MDKNLSISVIVFLREVCEFVRKSNISSAYRLILWSVFSIWTVLIAIFCQIATTTGSIKIKIFIYILKYLFIFLNIYFIFWYSRNSEGLICDEVFKIFIYLLLWGLCLCGKFQHSGKAYIMLSAEGEEKRYEWWQGK